MSIHSPMVRRRYVAALIVVVLGAVGVLAALGVHRWQHDRAVARYEAGERALAALQLPSTFHATGITDPYCVSMADSRCWQSHLSPDEALRAVPVALGLRARAMYPRTGCGRGGPCSVFIHLGQSPAAVVVFRSIVFVPRGQVAPPGTDLIRPGSPSQSYYGPTDVTVELRQPPG